MNGYSRGRILVVAYNLGVTTIAFIQSTRNTERGPANDFISANETQNFGGFTGKHGTNVEFEGHFTPSIKNLVSNPASIFSGSS